MDYEEYLQTPEWRRTAEIVKERAGGRCQLCNAAGPLEAHHRSYDHVRTAKEFEDLIALCPPCHEKYHEDPSQSNLCCSRCNYRSPALFRFPKPDEGHYCKDCALLFVIRWFEGEEWKGRFLWTCTIKPEKKPRKPLPPLDDDYNEDDDDIPF